MPINPHSWLDRIMKIADGHTLVVNEAVSGSGTTFTLAHSPVAGSLEFMMNGLTLKYGATSGGYTRSGVTITTTETWDADAVALANYLW
jgi:hypothetical protein